jgi:hypothetical protein
MWYECYSKRAARLQMQQACQISKGNAEQVLRQAQDERQVIDFVRGELVEPHSKPTCSASPKQVKKFE